MTPLAYLVHAAMYGHQRMLDDGYAPPPGYMAVLRAFADSAAVEGVTERHLATSGDIAAGSSADRAGSDLMTFAEYAVLANRHLRTIQRWAAAGRIEVVEVGAVRMVRRPERGGDT